MAEIAEPERNRFLNMGVFESGNLLYQKELEENCRRNPSYEAFRGSNILITGANGLICSYLTDTLLKMNDLLGLKLHVTALCRSGVNGKKRFADDLDREEFELLIGDAGRKDTYEKGSRYGRWDYIVHGAGNAHPKAFASQPVETMRTTLLGTAYLLEEALRQEVSRPVKKMLLLSSGEIYGKSIPSGKTGWKEQEPGTLDSMNLRACYPEGKRAAETLCASYAAEYGVNAAVVRLAYIYGVTMHEDNTRADVQFIRRAAAGEPVLLKSAGEQWRSYCYLQDAVNGILRVMTDGEAGEAYNIANAESNVTIRCFAETVAEVFGVPLRFEEASATERAGYSTMKQEILDAGKLEALGWKAKTGLRPGITHIRDMLCGSDTIQRMNGG